jgi:predicted dienelactone hydrolase
MQRQPFFVSDSPLVSLRTLALMAALGLVALGSSPLAHGPLEQFARRLAGRARALQMGQDSNGLAGTDQELRLIRAVRQDPATVVVLGWTPSREQGTTSDVERAKAPTGPWMTVATGQDGTYTDTQLTTPTWFRVTRQRAGHVLSRTRPLQVLPVAAFSYDEAAPEGRISALVRAPAVPGNLALPLVIIVHGTHGTCRLPDGRDVCPEQGACPTGSLTTPNAEGFTSLAETLAASGYVVASIDANAVGCAAPEDAIHGRERLLTGHLRAWIQGQVAAAHGLRIDPQRVGLVGHSTGGEAVAMMPNHLAALQEPWVRVARIRSVLAIAPADLLHAEPGAAALAVILPACDMDESTLSGRNLYDRALQVQGAPRAQWLLAGANHASFNTEWLDESRVAGFDTCEVGVGLGGIAQRAFLSAAALDWFAATLQQGSDGPQDHPLSAWLRGEAAVPHAVDVAAGKRLDLRVSHAAAQHLDLDPNSLQFEGFEQASACQGLTCSPEFGQVEAAVRLQWHDPSPRVTWNLTGLRTGGAAYVDLRLVARLGTAAAESDLPFRLRLRDTAGHVAEIKSDLLAPVHPPWTGVHDKGWLHYRREIASSVRAPLDLFTAVAPTLQRDHLASLELVLDGASCAVMLLDAALSTP